jgi:tight adherence protein B
MLLLSIAVFLIVALATFGLAMTWDQRNDQSRVIRERLIAVNNAASRGESEELQLLRDELLSEIPALNRWLAKSGRASRLQRKLSQAEVAMRPGKFLLLSACFAATAGLLGILLTRQFLFAAMFAVAGGFVLNIYVSFKRMRRFRRFEKMFPEAIDLLARAVRAGHAFTTALELIGNELAEPLSGEFRKTFEEQKFGMPVRDALLNLADRVPTVDVKLFVTAICMQRETGGNLAEIMDKLSYIIRERFKILRQVRVFTAQGRLTMIILMSLPPLLVVLMKVVNPGFIAPLFTDPIGHMLIAAGIIMQTMGFFAIRKIIDIKV